MRGVFVLIFAAFVGACATIDPPPNASRAAPAWPSLQRFTDDADLRAYLRAVAHVRQAQRDAAALESFIGRMASRTAGTRVPCPSYRSPCLRAPRVAPTRARQAQIEEICPPELYPCELDDAIVVTGTRIARAEAVAESPIVAVGQEEMRGTSGYVTVENYLDGLPQFTAAEGDAITNVQNAGVDEGGIVKLHGRYLVVLQDGRLISIDISGAQARLVDRTNVYRRQGRHVWYDEVLNNANRFVVTAYSYAHNATEFSVFSLGTDGRFTREGVYYVSSDDYYDPENYATRLVNGNLVIYTPLYVTEARDLRPVFPLVRRWQRDDPDTNRAVITPGRPLYEAQDIYRPIQSTLQPVIHTFSVCPLGGEQAGDELECRSTAIVGPPGRTFYVSTSHIYLWTYPEQGYNVGDLCPAGERTGFDAAVPSAIFQIPLSGGPPRAQFTRGVPWDQLSLDAANGELRALAVWIDPRCAAERRELPVRFFRAPFNTFMRTPRPLPQENYTNLPPVPGSGMENRFTATHLVYASRTAWSSHPPNENQQVAPGRIVVVPTARPHAATSIEAPHSALRVERLGPNFIVTGYADSRGLRVSVIDPHGVPRVASTILLEGRYESENRSHAFNGVSARNGVAIMGLPTVGGRLEAGRWWWRSTQSDVSFVGLDRSGALRPLGELSPRDAEPHEAYTCEVSCVDWYGNTRALFIRGRVFALAGVNLIEGELRDGVMVERYRLDLSAPVTY